MANRIQNSTIKYQAIRLLRSLGLFVAAVKIVSSEKSTHVVAMTGSDLPSHLHDQLVIDDVEIKLTQSWSQFEGY